MSNNRRNDRRRDTGGRRIDDGGFSLKSALYATIIILALGILAFFITINIYNKNLDKAYSEVQSTEIGGTIADKTSGIKTEEASLEIGKTVEELENDLMNVSVENDEIKEVSVNEENISEQSNQVSKETRQENVESNNEPVQEPDPIFEAPVAGDIMKEFAKDKLIYSETLKEWVIHTGIDIKADKTTVVMAAESGTVTAIKNDPRYGITVIIEHANGYETRYANLLTAEFVSVGETVTKGQTIGTVGNTATFEVLDDYHLHFEILKDGEYQDPILFI